VIEDMDHAAISVPNLERALAFYCDMLGFRVEVRSDWQAGTELSDLVLAEKNTAAKSALIRAGSSRIELFEYQSPVPVVQDSQRPVWDHGITHLCFNVQDIHAEYQRLGAAGVEFFSEPVRMGRWQFVYGRDPFGNAFELKQRD
jgi:catechol 2,3-dioxygenase-like lactoylglutathione lyase family enzyme